MKPVVLLAQVKDLYNYIKTVNVLDKNSIVEINGKLVKIMAELNENLAKIQ
jgi:hypothetical protein